MNPLDAAVRPVDLLFDPVSLSELLGRTVRASHLRWKRGVSAVARLHEHDGVGWVAVYSTIASDKLGKTMRRAEAHGVELSCHGFNDGVLVTGPIALDPKLYSPLHPLRRRGQVFPAPGTRVLKYNPFRRVVFRSGNGGGPDLVGRVGARKPLGATPAMLAGLQAHGVPVLVPLADGSLPAGLPAGRHIEYLPWYGEGDLSTLPLDRAAAAAYDAGAALALLHRQRPAGQAPVWRPVAERLHSLVRENAALLPERLDRLTRLSDSLEARLRYPGRAAVVHGDFSADQVLVGTEGIRFIDFERCTYGAAAADLGSFAAVELLAAGGIPAGGALATPRAAALLQGYGVGARTVSECEVQVWTAFYLLDRLREPFRACLPDWRERMDWRLALIEEVLR